MILFAVLFSNSVILRQLAEISQQSSLYILYGPTETNVCTYYKVERERLVPLLGTPSALPAPNTETFPVNPDGQLAVKAQWCRTFEGPE